MSVRAYRTASSLSLTIPVLNGGTLPSLLAQKLFLWYSAYSGVFLNSLLGFFASMLKSGQEKRIVQMVSCTM